jgi:hypothetical protein
MNFWKKKAAHFLVKPLFSHFLSLSNTEDETADGSPPPLPRAGKAALLWPPLGERTVPLQSSVVVHKKQGGGGGSECERLKTQCVSGKVYTTALAKDNEW